MPLTMSRHQMLGPNQESAPPPVVTNWPTARSSGGIDAPLLEPRPFIVGSPRSGTTLLRLMLDAHPQLAIPAETHFIPALLELRSQGEALRADFMRVILTSPRWPDFHLSAQALESLIPTGMSFRLDDGIRAFYRCCGLRQGKSRCGDKTPGYVLHLKAISAILPEVRFIHLIRDGRGVAASLRHLWWGPGPAMAAQAADWVRRIQEARRQAAFCPHYLEVRYEELVLRTEAALRNICAFLELDYVPDLLQYHRRSHERLQELNTRKRADGSIEVTQADLLRIHRLTEEPPRADRINDWRRVLTRSEIEEYENIAGPTLRDLGYAMDYPAP